MLNEDQIDADHHWVSQWFLRGFEAVGYPGRIYAYQRSVPYPTMRNPSLVGIRSIAQEQGFNTLTSNDGTVVSAGLELLFKMHEDQAKPIVERLKNEPSIKMSDVEREQLAQYIAILVFANPRTREMHGELIPRKEEQLEFMERNRERLIEGFVKEHPEIPDARERMIQSLDNPDQYYESISKQPKTTVALGTIRAAYGYAPYLIDSKWQLVITDESKELIIADHPVIATPPEDYEDKWETHYFECPLILPISPSRCIQISGRDEPDDVITIGSDMIDLVNHYSMFFAEEEVYSRSPSEEIKEAFGRTVEGASRKAFKS